MFDGLLQACGYRADRLSKVDREILNASAANLRDSGVPNTEAGFNLIQAVAKAYKADRKLAEHTVAGFPSPSSLAKHWHALVRQVKPSVKATRDAAAAKATKERMEQENKAWWPKRLAIIQAIVAEADAVEVERIWQNLRTSMRLPKKATMDMHLGKIAEAVAPGELARRMED